MLELIGIDGLTQWDVGRQIKVDKDIDMVHFSNRPYGYSKNVKVTDGVADVPDMFLTSCAPLHVWAYVGDFEKGYTKIEKIYEVKPKNRPEDYIYTPEEVKTWEKLQDEIGNLAYLATDEKSSLVAAINEVGSIQPDWAQNDETAKDYIKNRTHWVEEKAVLEETTFTIEESDGMCALGNFPATLSAGDICTVVYDGKTYTCTVFEFETDIARIGCDAFEIVFQNQPDGLCAITILSYAGEHTISILQTTYHTLNPKYIKDMYYSEIGEGVIGTGANGWIKVTNYQAITIPKMAINGTIYENVPVDHVANRYVYYVVGGHTLEFDRMSSSMNADGLSDDDVVFYGETQIYHTIPDEFIPWEESPTADSILYTAQSLTEEQQAQARANIGADISTKMDANNPVGTGSFSMNRKAGTVVGVKSHAEGDSTTASGNDSHAEGFNTRASGDKSHAEGLRTIASGDYSHAEGNYSTASGSSSHAEGYLTTASGTNSHVQGKYNIEDNSNVYADIIGNGTSDTARSNAATVDWNGNAWFAGDVYTGSTSGTNKDDGSKKLATEEYVNSSIAAGGTDISLGLTSAAVGQIIKVKAVDESGKPTAWEAADMPSGDRWELINAIEIPDGTEETNALTISADKNGNAFSLKKARLITYFPKYTGESSIPGYSFTMINGITVGPQAPLCYTSGLPSPNNSKNSEGWLEVDLSMPGYEVERVARFAGSDGRPAELVFWGARRLNGAETITSIGGTNMLIYPGCKFTLYGVRA